MVNTEMIHLVSRLEVLNDQLQTVFIFQCVVVLKYEEPIMIG